VQGLSFVWAHYFKLTDSPNRHLIAPHHEKDGILSELPRDILHCIGNTSLLALRKIVPHGSRILLKLENENPTGSIKDRMALAMIEAAEGDGRLTVNGSVVEYTGGSTGVSLSLVCAVKGYPLHIVSSDAFSREKLDHMKILGAELQIVPSESGRMTEKLTRDMVEAARIIAEKTGGFWTDQLNNTDQLAAYHKMAEEIWVQTEGQIDGFVQSVGTAASLRGVTEGLRRRNEQIKIVAVEPSESPVLSGGQTGAHKIDGVGAGFVVPLWREDIADLIEQVSTEEAVAMALRLAREEGLFAGTSTGGNVIAALRLAEQLGPGATIVTVMCDTGMKYLSRH
jgi:cysteine synthase A